MLNRPDSSLFCHDTGSIRGRFIFLPGLFLYFFQKSKHLFKKNRAVKAAKRICSKRCRLENWVFLHSITLFLKNEAQINKNNYAMMLFMSKQVSLPKIGSILQKNENHPQKAIIFIRPFCTKSFLYVKLQSAVHHLSKYTSKNFWNVYFQISSFLVCTIVLASQTLSMLFIMDSHYNGH